MTKIATLRKLFAEATPGRAVAREYHLVDNVLLDGRPTIHVFNRDASTPIEEAARRHALAALLAAAVNALPALLDAVEAWRDYLSAQRTIDGAGYMDNYTDAARARDTQAKAIDRARRALAAVEGK